MLRFVSLGLGSKLYDLWGWVDGVGFMIRAAEVTAYRCRVKCLGLRAQGLFRRVQVLKQINLLRFRVQGIRV